MKHVNGFSMKWSKHHERLWFYTPYAEIHKNLNVSQVIHDVDIVCGVLPRNWRPFNISEKTKNHKERIPLKRYVGGIISRLPPIVLWVPRDQVD